MPLTALFCMSVLCLLTSHCQQSCTDFWLNAVTALRASPGHHRSHFLCEGALKLASTQRGERCMVFLQKAAPISALLLQIPSSALGFTGWINSRGRSTSLSSNTHLNATQVSHQFTPLLFSSLKFSLSGFEEKSHCDWLCPGFIEC